MHELRAVNHLPPLLDKFECVAFLLHMAEGQRRRNKLSSSSGRESKTFTLCSVQRGTEIQQNYLDKARYKMLLHT
jgi:hypothetical protein